MEEIKYRFEEVNIRDIEESPINAQVMSEQDFKRLTENIKKDKCLTSSVLLMEQQGKKLMCISGHHRIRAAIKAGLKKVPSLIINEVTESTRLRLQLIHNDIHGTPDPGIISILQSKLNEIDITFVANYEKFVSEIDKFTIEAKEFYHTVICLLPENHERLKEIIYETDNKFDERVLVEKEDYQLLKEALTLAFKSGFKTPGQAFRRFLEQSIELLNAKK